MRHIPKLPFLLSAGAVALMVLACEDQTLTDVVPQFSVTDNGDSDGLFHACYIPGSGMVYRISAEGVEGLKEDCRANRHIEFSWPASLPLAGQSCPDGQLMTGVDAQGSLLCASPAPG